MSELTRPTPDPGVVRWLDTDLARRFAGRVLPVDREVADRWGRLAANAQLGGAPLPVIDGLLAATAEQFNLTVVSRNVRDFGASGITTMNPWEDAKM